MKNLKKYFTIFLSIGIAYIASAGIKSELFIADTPQLNRPLNEYVAYRVSSVVRSVKNATYALLQRPEEIDNRPADADTAIAAGTLKRMQDVVLQPLTKIAPGVYAQNLGNVTQITIKENEKEWTEYSYHINGKDIKIRVEKGREAPTKEEVEKSY